MPDTRVTLENPPINEVVIAVYFGSQLVDFRSQHVGLFWKRIRDEFPVVRQQFPVGIGTGVGPEETFPMPRYWFVAHDEVNLVQVEKNAFMLNWRRRGNNVYPGFQGVKSNFDRLYGEFEDFLKFDVDTSEVMVELCELTYIDVIPQCEYWRKPGDTSALIPSFSNLYADFDVTFGDFDCRYVVHSGHDVTLSKRIWTINKAGQSGLPALGIEMKATNRFASVRKTGTDDWFWRAHDETLKHFMNLTSEDIQRDHWRLRAERAE